MTLRWDCDGIADIGDGIHDIGGRVGMERRPPPISHPLTATQAEMSRAEDRGTGTSNTATTKTTTPPPPPAPTPPGRRETSSRKLKAATYAGVAVSGKSKTGRSAGG